MPFEDTLRSEMQRQAGAVTLPSRTPEQAAGRAHQRRTRRRVVAATVAVAAIAAVAVPPALSGDDPDDVNIGTAGQGLPATGPLDIAWQQADGGVSNFLPVVQDTDGVVYTLSTGPGTRATDYPMGDAPRTIYRLADDGTWQPISVDEASPMARDLAAADGVLYTIATGPGEGGGVTARLSSSADGGQTWAPQEVSLPDPPSDEITWSADTRLALESTASDTIAIVTTAFAPDVTSMFPDWNDDGSFGIEETADGYSLVRFDVTPPNDDGAASGRQSADPAAPGPRMTQPPTTPTTVTDDPPPTVPGGDPATDPASEEAANRARAARVHPEQGKGGEVVDSVTWAELGIEGDQAPTPAYQVFRRSGDTWQELPGAGESFGQVKGLFLDTAGGRFVAWMWQDGNEVVFTSEDGSSWAPVTLPAEGELVTMGSALVLMPAAGMEAQVSTDAGATWAPVDLSRSGLDRTAVYSYDAGPLGLAVLAGDPDAQGGPTQLAITGDLHDWTVVPLTDVVGPDPVGMARVFVGEDRVVVSAVGGERPGALPASRTAVGVPHRG